MGIFLEAKCKCGYRKEQLSVGTGFKGGYIAPAICINCGDISTQDFQTYLETKSIPSCSICNGSMKFYNHKSLRKKVTKEIWDEVEKRLEKAIWTSSHKEQLRMESLVKYLTGPDLKDSVFELPTALYFCPNCKKYRMKFIETGLWD